MTASDDDPRDPKDGKPRFSARELNARPLPRRFFTSVTVGERGASGVPVLLDGKAARTPKKSELRVPSLALARTLAGEWAAQDERIDPARMPMTRLVNTAIDGVMGREADVRADVVKYAGSDLVCYRAERPDGLIKAQAKHWDPVLAWGEQHGICLTVQRGLVHVAQPEASVAAVAHRVAPLAAFELTALHTMLTLTGSALLALGVVERAWDVEAAWNAAHVDEDWQIAEWGEDEEAAARRTFRSVEMAAAGRLLDALRAG